MLLAVAHSSKRIFVDFNIAQVRDTLPDVLVRVCFDVLRKFCMLRSIVIRMLLSFELARKNDAIAQMPRFHAFQNSLIWRWNLIFATGVWANRIWRPVR